MNVKEIFSGRDKVILFKKVFGTKEGKDVLKFLMKRFWVTTTHKGSELEEGQRAAILYILDMCKTDIDEFDRLMED